jgi:YVTN family beta-propeller protein
VDTSSFNQETKTFNTETIKTGQHPYGVTISPDGQWLYVTNNHADNISVIDAQTKKTVSTIAVGEFPEGIDYDRASNHIFVANWGTDNVSVIDAKTNKVINTIASSTLCRSFGRFIFETP